MRAPLLLPILLLAACAGSPKPKVTRDFLLPVRSADPELSRLQAILKRTTDKDYAVVLHNPHPKTLVISLYLRYGETTTEISPPGYLGPYQTETLAISLPAAPTTTNQNNRLVPTVNGDPISLEPRRATVEDVQSTTQPHQP